MTTKIKKKLFNDEIKTPESLRNAFKEIDEKFLSESRDRMNKESKENSQVLDKLENDSFTLNKDLLILTGTIFGSSIALAAGRQVNNTFILGEFILFISLATGLIILSAQMSAKEWSHAFSAKFSIESFLLLNKTRIDKLERETLESLVNDYEKIIMSNQSGLLYFLLKKISVEKWPKIFRLTFLLGTFLILASLINFMPLLTFTNQMLLLMKR